MSDRRFHELYPVTSLLVLLNVGMFTIEYFAQDKLGPEIRGGGLLSVHPDVLTLLGGMVPVKVSDGDVWRLLSCAFLHGGLLHILMNMIVLADLGRFCEPLLSGPKYFSCFLLSAVGSSVASFGYHTATGAVSTVSIGASGGIAGLIGLALAYSIKERHPQLRDMLLRWVIMIVLITFLIPGIDHAAHAGGFLAGGLLGLTVTDYTTSRTARRWRYPSYVAGGILTVTLGWALWNHFSRIVGA